MSFQMQSFETVFENDDYIVVNKPSGLLTMPGRGSAAGEKNLLALLTRALKRPMYVVHRLDKDASGLILFAKTEAAHKYFSGLFERTSLGVRAAGGDAAAKKPGGIEKKYLAAVHGLITAGGEVNKPIRQYGSGRMGVGFGGKDSVTKYAVLEHYKRATLLEVELISGRRHQIRVHLYHIGHPVIGDRLYGDPAEQALYPRLMLHSYSMKFAGMQGEKRAFRADPPEDFLGVLPCL
ncbi:MAG: RNA pseudouridine synthase [Elusimicrobia bacterium]|nr:RNA pseudouridine synthase [Elusimicrobiota bacterium]